MRQRQYLIKQTQILTLLDSIQCAVLARGAKDEIISYPTEGLKKLETLAEHLVFGLASFDGETAIQDPMIFTDYMVFQTEQEAQQHLQALVDWWPLAKTVRMRTPNRSGAFDDNEYVWVVEAGPRRFLRLDGFVK
ncbi:hypothetical protein [Candidatus Entotheonella palauensis]|uniref:hypothetical protein n=1 Tax=Candidatus Entotheonella palauensis TaxID=93172 RepID=UPI000B7DD86B|nr:hypothetical protein [Candidatus Entotheonella palauensis]